MCWTWRDRRRSSGAESGPGEVRIVFYYLVNDTKVTNIIYCGVDNISPMASRYGSTNSLSKK